MRIHICAAGKLRRGPEQEITDTYLKKFAVAGRSLGFRPVRVHETDRRGMRRTGTRRDLHRRLVPGGAVSCALDENGAMLSSPEFARLLRKWRMDSVGDAAFLIGGAEGLGATLLRESDMTLSLGPMVFPHALVRAMLSEQLYRAVSILNGSPYHRY